MSDNRKVVIPIVGDSTGFKQSAEDVKAAGRDMAQSLQQSAQQAGQAVEKVGSGAAPAAAKMDAATRSIIGSIQRTTAVMEAGGRTTAKYYEALAAQRGVSVDVLKPYLAQLDAVQARQAQATAGLQAQGAAMAGTALSAKQLQFALRGVPAQFTDIVTSLASGQRPLQVLIQQGGQLKDVFGGIGPAARALGGYVVGLINPLTLGAAAVGAVALAAHQGSEELRAFQNAATMTGNAIGVSAGRFGELRDSIAEIAGTKGKAAEALTAIAQSGIAAGDNVRGIAEAAILMEKATGQAISKTVEQFKELQKSPADAAAKLNEQYNFLTASIYKQIKALEDQGRATDAARLAEQTYADALKTRAQQVVDNAGYMEKAWRGVIGAAKGAWDAMLGIGRDKTGSEQLAELKDRLAKREAFGPFHETRELFDKTNAGLREQIALIERVGRVQEEGAKQKAEQNRLQQLGIQFEKDGEQFATRAQQREKELTKARIEGQQLVLAGLITERELTERLAAIRQKYNDTTGQGEVAGIKARTEAARQELFRLRSASAEMSRGGTPSELTEGEKLVLKIQEELRTGLTGVARAQKEKALAAAQALAVVEQQVAQEKRLGKELDGSVAARAKNIESIQEQATKIREQAVAQEAANASTGKSRTAIEQETLAKFKSAAADEVLGKLDPERHAAMLQRIADQERFVDALRQAEFVQKSRSLDEAGRVASEETQSLQLEVSLLGRSQQERERIIAQRRVEVALAKELAEIDKLNVPDAQKAELRAKAESNARVQQANAEQKVILDEWQRTTDSINQSLTDALLRGFESGKDFAGNFRDTLKNMFQTLVLRPVIQAALSPVSGALSGIGQSIVGGGGSVLGALGNVASIGSLFGAGATTSTGLGLLAGEGGMLGGIGAGIGGFASEIGASLGIGAGATTSTGLGLLGADAAAAAGGTMMAGIGAALPWVGIGLVAANALGLFDHGGPKTESGFGAGVPLRGDPSSSKAIADAVQAQYRAIAGQFAKDLQLGVFTATDPQGTAQTQLAFEAALNGRTISSRGARLGGIENVGRSPEALQAAIAEESSRVVLDALQATNLPGQIGDYLRQLGDIDKLSGGALAEAVQKVQKAMAERQTLEQRLFDLTHTELEKSAAVREKERAAIDDTNRALYDHVAALSDLKAAEASARETLLSAYQRESDALRGVIERHTNYAAQLRAVRDGLVAEAPSSLAARRARADSVFEGTLSSAVSGNEQAIQDLGAAGKALIEAVQASAQTPAELAAAVARVQAGLTTAAASSEGRASAAQQQLDAMTQQLSALGLINTSVVSVGEALGQFLGAQTAIQQEVLRYTALIAAQQAASDQAAAEAAAAAAAASVSAATGAATSSFADFQQNFGVFLNYADMIGTGNGAATGGWRGTGPLLVGELGPEVVDFETPGRVYTNEQTRGMFASNAALEPLLREISAKLDASDVNRRREAVAMLQQQVVVAAKLKKFDVDGMPAVRV